MKIGGRLAVVGILLLCWAKAGICAIELGGSAGMAVSTNENMSKPFAFSLFASIYTSRRTMLRLEYGHLEYGKGLALPRSFDRSMAKPQQTPRVKSFLATFEAQLLHQWSQYRRTSFEFGLGLGVARVMQQRNFRVWELPGPGKDGTDFSPLFSLSLELRLRPWSELPARILIRMKHIFVVVPEYRFLDYRPGIEYQVWGLVGAVLDF